MLVNFFSDVAFVKHNVIYILYNSIWFISGFCSLHIGWPAGSLLKRTGLRGEWPGLESCAGVH